jgi:predicted nucleotidyltransferase component of viral defense system
MTSPKRRKVITFREDFVRRAQDVNVPPNDYERAFILAQIADLLIADKRIENQIAFHGGTIMRLIDNSPRLSRDLDGVFVGIHKLRSRQVKEILSSPQARKFIVSGWNKPRENKDSITFPHIECRSFSWKGTVPISISFHFGEKIIDPTEIKVIHLPTGNEISLLVISARERYAGKVAAFVRRGYESDAYDIYHYHKKVLETQLPNPKISRLINNKISVSKQIKEGDDLHLRFDTWIEELENLWDKSTRLSITSQRPSWKDVKTELQIAKKSVPQFKPPNLDGETIHSL